MAVEEIGRLRTIAIVGQGGAGKTMLAEAMLFTAGMTTRLGRPDDGTATMDFESERIWEAAGELGLPRIAFVSKLERERSNFELALKDLAGVLEAKPAPLCLPIGLETAFSGIVDLINMK